MAIDISNLVSQIADLPSNWHGAGTVGRNVLHAMARYAGESGRFQRSMETGSGKTTLLLSHLSDNHTVFAVDDGDSISRVKGSELFESRRTTFIEGPTQRTLPRHAFTPPYQFALIDGPHGYPFPDLEYYYIYPMLAPGALLVIDDLKIPTIARMFDIIKSEAMFQVLEVVDSNTAFLRRTTADCIDPESDSWWLQNFNKPYYDAVLAKQDGRVVSGPQLGFVTRVRRKLSKMIAPA